MVENKLKVKSVLLPIIFGAVAAIGCWAFVTPNDFASAGVEGISVLLERVVGWKVNYWQLVFNVPLCVFAFFFISRRFALLTCVYSLSYMVVYAVCDKFANSALRYVSGGRNTIYPVILEGVLTGVVYGVLFRNGGSTGGVDIASKYINKKNPRFNFFYVNFAINATIAIVSCFVFPEYIDGRKSYSYAPACMCVLCDFISNIIGDKMLKGGESACKFIVISEKVREIERDIAENLVHTSTRFIGYGSYSNQEKQCLMCVVTKNEIVDFENILKNYPDCFSYVENVNKVIGYFDRVKK